MVNVVSVLNKVELTMSITNKKVYLISRGCVYEHLLKNFKPNSLDRAFSLKNKHVKKMVKEQKLAKMKVDRLTRKPSEGGESGLSYLTRYSRKFVSGRVIGLQNLIPEFTEHGEVVFFTDNHMVAEVYEVNIEPLRQALSEDKQMLHNLWTEILPSALLQLDQ